MQKLGTIAVVLAGLNSIQPIAAFAAPVSFTTQDGVLVYGELLQTKQPARGTIVLFHMAGSNRGEYEPIAPLLNAAGFSTLAIDQRSGGDLWGRANQTVEHSGNADDYALALPDLAAAVDFADRKSDAPVIVWGSSYSAALVFIVAAKEPAVKGLLAFSPAEYITGFSVSGAAAKLKIPVFVSSASDPGEVRSAREIADAVPQHRAVQYVPAIGTHGSSSLRKDQDPAGADENLRHVMSFLDSAFPRN